MSRIESFKVAFLKIWKDPVLSKVIATGIIFMIASIYPAFKTGDVASYFKYFGKPLSLPYWALCLLIIGTACLVVIASKMMQKKKPFDMDKYFDEEYEKFKSKPLFEHFEVISDACNRRMYMDGLENFIINYYLSHKIIYDARPGYGYYGLTKMGIHFFHKYSIEKVENNSK
ncbi:MAG: hypothetical protein IPO63_08495 [Bacteroidetes bacterium]|nr:hypothetical protein [Bacteroidota bacterium]